MYKVVLTLALALTPAALSAQAVGAKSQTKADAQVRAGNAAHASAHTSVDAEIAVARERGLPTKPMERRAAEARAKGATEAQAALAARKLRANFETAHEAMVSAGRTQPRDEEVERGGYAIERGYTRADVALIAKSAPSDRSLVVAFDVLTRLVDRGVASANALAQVQSRLESRAPDADIDALVGANAAVGAGRGAVGAAASGNAAAGAAVGGAAGAVKGSVGGVVGGVIKKP